MNELEYLLSQKGSAALFFITIGISLYTLYFDEDLFDYFKFNPYNFFRRKHYHTIFTSGFVHADFTHLLFNMFTFYFFAFHLEAQIGIVNFLVIYLVSLVLSDLHVLFLHRNNPKYSSVGASGAITAVLFASTLYNPNMGIGLFFVPFFIPAPIFACLYIGICVYLNKKDNVSNINHLAHLWGAISGLVLAVAMNPSVVKHFIETIDLSQWF